MSRGLLSRGAFVQEAFVSRGFLRGFYLKGLLSRGDFVRHSLHTYVQQNARPWLCVNKVPPTMELAKIKEEISRIDPVVGMENWEIRIEGLHRKFKGTYPTQLVLFKVQNYLIAKNISDQNFTIDGKQFKIREYLESTSFRCTRCEELGFHLSKDCSNPKKMREMCWTRL